MSIIFENEDIVITDNKEGDTDYWLWHKVNSIIVNQIYLTVELYQVYDDGSESVVDFDDTSEAKGLLEDRDLCIQLGGFNRSDLDKAGNANRFHLNILYGSDAIRMYNNNGSTEPERAADEADGSYEEYIFHTTKERECFLQGVAAGEGWQGYEIISEDDYIADEPKRVPLPNHRWVRSPKQPDWALNLDKDSEFFGWKMKEQAGKWVSQEGLSLKDINDALESGSHELQQYRLLLKLLRNKLGAHE